MLDTDYIKEIQALDKKEAKEKLDEYAQQFNIKLKKTKSFENMLADLESELTKLANEPLPEDNTGLSISDMIQADDELNGKAVFTGEAPEAALQLLIDEPSNAKLTVKDVGFEVHTPSIKDEGFAVPTSAISDKGFSLEAPIGDSLIIISDNGEVKKIKNEELNQESFNEAMDKLVKIVQESEKEFVLPDGFSPNVNLLGKNPGYVTLPWWIYQWIEATPDWKSKPTSFTHPSAHQTLFSLLYYIKRDGFVRIRETRNSRFYTLS